MIADYSTETGEPGAPTQRSASAVNSDMDRAKFMLSWRSAFAATSSLAFPGFVINRALPGAVVAAIAFAVPGLSLEHQPDDGDVAGRLAMAGMGTTQRNIEIARPVTLGRLERNPPEVLFVLPVLAPPDPPDLSNNDPNSAGEKRTRAYVSTPRESDIPAAPQNDLSVTHPRLEEAGQGSEGFEQSQAGISRRDEGGLVDPMAGDTIPSLTLPEITSQSAASDSFLGELKADAYDVAPLAQSAFPNGEAASAKAVVPTHQAAAELSRTGGIPGEPAGNLVSGANDGLADDSRANALASPERPETAPRNRSAAADSFPGPPETGVGDARGPAKLALRSTEAAPAGALDIGPQAEIEMVGYAEQAPVRTAGAGASQIQQASQHTVALTRRAEIASQLARGSDQAAEIAGAPNAIREILPENAAGESAFAPRLKSRSFVAGNGIPGASAVEITSRLATRIDGKVAGELDFQQDMQTIKIRIGSIVELLKDRYETADLNRIARSASGDVYLSIAQLQQAGIPISYDPVYDELAFGTKDYLPRAAHKVQVDQITAPQRDLGPIVMEQIPR